MCHNICCSAKLFICAVLALFIFVSHVWADAPPTPYFDITVSVPGGHGTISCPSPVQAFNNDVCTITPDSGYYLSSFTDNDVNKLGLVAANSYTIYDVQELHIITGVFVNSVADLQISKTVSSGTNQVAFGANVTFTVTAKNNGPSSATNAQILDLLPIGYTYVSSTPSVGTYTSGTGVWNIGTIAYGAAPTLQITATVLNFGPYANTASVLRNDAYDNISSNNSASATPVVPSTTIMCDVNGDGLINSVDINLIVAARNTAAQAYDPRDLDKDGFINTSDARGCTFRCDNPTCVVVPRATRNDPYSTQLSNSGGTAPYSYAITAGSLPSGITLNGGTGILSGTPTVAGSTSFTVTRTDSKVPTPAIYTTSPVLYVDAPFSIATGTLSAATRNIAYSQTVSATGGYSPYRWSIASGSLPAGLSLNVSTGAITGTPTVSGTATFTIKAMDTFNRAVTKSFSIVVGG